MLSFFRGGPKLVVFGSRNISSLNEFLVDNFKGVITDLDNALEISDENSTIVFITEPGKRFAHYDDIKSIILLPVSSDEFFSGMFNTIGNNLILDCHIAPGILIMRTLGDCEKVIQSVQETYGGEIYPLHESLDRGTFNDTVICFTDKPIDKKNKLSDLNEKTLLVKINYHELNRKIRNQALRFLNEGLVGVDWNEINIRIYDRYSKYKLHYDRLCIILDNFDIGLVLGETWTKDYPRFMMSVLVYQVRLFTLMYPVEIKRILLGLEYLDDGERIVDLDLIFKNKKVDWPEAKDKNTKGYDRWQLGLKYRREILEKLDEDSIKKLYRIEDEIRKSRV
ncbi:hypothetical protein ABG79_00047 [Caloramator mitchellensis]|uniref:Uncharacterized protein n=1 Tax=Caloramator mitchellensis TaxID=908809 RepID=A0A0R3JXT9_CALMK|nr:hypothetical protein [Caloramator mitchellensis]KRQ87882.1 hypothetical protein ABG79_00047 [Caloramator mitchellensis]